MNMKKKILGVVEIFLFTTSTFILVSTVQAGVVNLASSNLSGPSDSISLLQQTDDTYLGWSIGSFDNPFEIGYGATYGPFIKELQGPNGEGFAATEGDQFFLSEYLIIRGNTPWTDWHEELPEGWVWTDLGVGITDPDTWYGDLDTPLNESVLDINFLNPVTVGSVVIIGKMFTFVGLDSENPNETFNGILNVAEYPTVPEPATLALMGLGLAGLGFARKKKV